MRILVLSDSHGNSWVITKALQKQPTAEVVIFLGDGVDDMEANRRNLRDNQMLVMVKGNNDWACNLPYDDFITVAGKKIAFTHGHTHNVKSGLYPLTCFARENKADIVLFGHTHSPLQQYDDGLYIMNPGSIGHSYTGSDCYGIIDITNAGIVTNIVNID